MSRATIDFIEQSKRIASRQELFDLFSAQMEKLGFGIVVYSDLQAPPDSARTFLLSNVSEPARLDYANRRIRSRVAISARSSNAPVLWYETARRGKDIEFLNWMMDHRIKDGIVIPLHEAMGSSMGIAVGTQEKSINTANMAPVVGRIAVQFHFSYQLLTQAPINRMILTQRETEVLRWCAAGKSNGDIGEILSISAHTVDFHLRNVYRKLGTGDRVSSTLKAFTLGLISAPF